MQLVTPPPSHSVGGERGFFFGFYCSCIMSLHGTLPKATMSRRRLKWRCEHSTSAHRPWIVSDCELSIVLAYINRKSDAISVVGIVKLRSRLSTTVQLVLSASWTVQSSAFFRPYFRLVTPAINFKPLEINMLWDRGSVPE